MKKVRLFAVAAAMGMFAATVNAAPTVTKDAYAATWGTMDEIVRAEFGGKVVLPTPNVTVTKQGRTTVKPTTGLLNPTCYVGLTDQVGKDTNGDGLVDYAVLSWGAESAITGGTTPDFSERETATDGWYYDDMKFFPTINTALFYLGMTSDGIGARFIAPNAAAEKGWIISSTHKKYATEADVLAALEEAGVLKPVKDSRNDIVKYVVGEKEYKDAATGAKLGKVWLEYAAGSGRYDLQELPEYVVSKFDGTTTTLTSVTPTYRAVEYFQSNNTTAVNYSAVLPSGATGGAHALDLAGNILAVEENRYGELVTVEAYAGATGIGGITNTDSTKVVVVLKDGANYSKFMTITEAVPTSGTEYDMKWDAISNTFVKEDRFATINNALAVAFLGTGKVQADLEAASTPVAQKTAKGLYKYNNPANTTDRIVINFDMGVYTSWGLNVSGINTSKSTISFTDAFGAELTTSAVKIGNKWYPTVADRTELQEFVRRMAGIREASTSFIQELNARKVYSTITWADGTKDSEYIPANPLAHYKAQQCTYATTEATVDAASVVVTSNAADVNTTQYGVHNVTLTAKVGETVVGTKDVKVVIAPKYVREYKNGKVTSLKAYHLNGNLYSHTTFDYAKKSSTSVFYAQDGVTAIETQTNTIK